MTTNETEYVVLLPGDRDRPDTETVTAPTRFQSATETILAGMMWEEMGLIDPGWDWGQV